MSADESKDEQLNRELIELLNELRVALPGVQMLFGFLLAVPFSQRFQTITTTQRNVYYATFLSTAFASIFFIAPTAYHRLRFRQGDKEALIQTSSRLAIVGTTFLALALAGAVFVVTDIVFKGAVTAAATGAAAAVLVWFWYGLPIFAGSRIRTTGRSRRIRRVRRNTGCAARPRCSPPGLRPQSRPYLIRYERSLRPCLGTSIAAWQRANSAKPSY